MILGFSNYFQDGSQTNFKEKIMACWDNKLKDQYTPKIHTIREDKNNRWKTGNKIHFATGVRTKNYYCFNIDKCKLLESILIVNHGNFIFVKIGTTDNYIHNDCIDFDENKKHDSYLLEKLFTNDGLTYFQFKDWFVPNKNDKFQGKIIHWTDFKYLV
jgi:hypothetical protein